MNQAFAVVPGLHPVLFLTYDSYTLARVFPYCLFFSREIIFGGSYFNSKKEFKELCFRRKNTPDIEELN